MQGLLPLKQGVKTRIYLFKDLARAKARFPIHFNIRSFL